MASVIVRLSSGRQGQSQFSSRDITRPCGQYSQYARGLMSDFMYTAAQRHDKTLQGHRRNKTAKYTSASRGWPAMNHCHCCVLIRTALAWVHINYWSFILPYLQTRAMTEIWTKWHVEPPPPPTYTALCDSRPARSSISMEAHHGCKFNFTTVACRQRAEFQVQENEIVFHAAYNINMLSFINKL